MRLFFWDLSRLRAVRLGPEEVLVESFRLVIRLGPVLPTPKVTKCGDPGRYLRLTPRGGVPLPGHSLGTRWARDTRPQAPKASTSQRPQLLTTFQS
jgi:hypothetical protein